MTSFAEQTAPKMGELEDRIAALESARQILIDGTWTRFTAGFSDGLPGFSVDFQGAVVVTATLAKAAAVPLTTATARNVTQMSVGPFRWLVFGMVGYTNHLSDAPTVSYMAQAASATSATLPAARSNVLRGSGITIDPGCLIVPAIFDFTTVTGNSDIYLTCQSAFSGGALDAYGQMLALRLP